MVNIIFVHPNLGIGGAERAVVDAAMALKSRGHSVRFVTAHHDPTHCFEETQDGRLDVTVVGNWIPTNVFGGMFAMCAYVRMIYAAFYIIFSTMHYELLIVDQVSACIPVLKLRKAKIIFYCHYPDLLLTTRESTLKSLYRAPLDWFEEKTTGLADIILVNSKFTGEIFKETFKGLAHRETEILYPIPNFTSFNKAALPPTEDIFPAKKKYVFLSINRYERKKNLPLALEAFMHLDEKISNSNEIHLVIAGGYDERVAENRQHYLELRQLAAKLQIENNVTFFRSFNAEQKLTLLTHSTCLLYTPDKEHFGIVPVEAMYMKLPVIAVSSGGPRETVDHGRTGFLCEPTPEMFADAMEKFLNDPNLKNKMGEEGHDRMKKLFSFDAFTERLNKIVESLCPT